MTDLTLCDLVELSDLIEAKKASPVEIAQAFLDRIEAENGHYNAFVTMTAEAALETAKAAEAEISAGKRRGALHGLPIGHKDLYATAGVLTTGGSRVLADNAPAEDSTVVARLAEAGMVTLGKLNTHEFAYGPTGENSSFGPTRNPWDTDRITGGSSSGSGAVVAAGLAPVATGSDTGGSIRMPAACCGVTGLKPTYGRVPRTGILPLCWTMDHSGPLSRTAKDSALILQATAGADGRDAAAPDRPVDDYLSGIDGGVKGMRIGICREYFYDLAQTQVTDVVEAALKELEKLGAVLVEVEIPHISLAGTAAFPIYAAEATAYHDDTMDDRIDLFTDQVRVFLEIGDQVLAKDYLHAQRYRSMLGQSMAEVMKDVDVLATPGIAITATPIGDVNVAINGTEEPIFGAILRNTEPFDLTGLPALVVPCGFAADGLPVSLQLAGRAFDEATVLRAGHAFQQATDWHTKRPPRP
ncbi:MAG: amidase [Minwuia sp.]|uniref:amidase n=1 Tax=Minwuia sp. TaxID=2493630 RepID=UPI003A8865A0